MLKTLDFPGSVGLTHLRVYDSLAPDGLRGGSPHVHFACTECYYVQAGAGRVQTLSSEGYREFELQKGALVWFSPGVIHRLINDGELEIFVVMENGGLPEAGDFVLTFPPDILRDSSDYFAAASLSSQGEVFAAGEDAAMKRRDLAVEGFHVLRRDYGIIGSDILETFYEMALPLLAPKLTAWENVWQNGPLAAAQTTGERLKALQSGDVSHLLNAATRTLNANATRKLGMCGTLGTYLPEGKTVASRDKQNS